MARSVKSSFYDKDMGYKALATKFSGKKGGSVFVGLLQSSGTYKPKGEKGGSSISVAQVAAIHEFGSSDGRIPQRSFMGSAIDENEGRLNSLLKKLTAKVVDGTYKESHALGLLGQFVVDLFRNKINSGLKPPLAAATIKRKGADKSKPLIDTGQLIGSISFEVRKK